MPLPDVLPVVVVVLELDEDEAGLFVIDAVVAADEVDAEAGSVGALAVTQIAVPVAQYVHEPSALHETFGGAAVAV